MTRRLQWAVALLVLGAMVLSVPDVAWAGSPIGGDRFPIHNSASVAEVEAAAAYNSQLDEYLVVWEGAGIEGQRVDADGTLLGSAFQI